MSPSFIFLLRYNTASVTCTRELIMSCQGLINYNYNCAVHNTQNKMHTRQPGSQVRGKSFKKGRVSTTSGNSNSV